MRGQLQRVRTSFDWSLTPVVRLFLWINGLVFVFMALAEGRPFFLSALGSDEAVDARAAVTLLLGLVPQSVTKSFMLWQPVTYMFLHANIWHLFFNMIGLFFFGPEIERQFGSGRFLRYYFFCGVGGAVAAVLLYPSSIVPTIGASGAIFGLLLAYGVLFPNRTIYLYFVLPIRAKYFVLGFGLLTAYSVVKGSESNVSHIAHFGGMIFGLIWFGWLRTNFRFGNIWKYFRRRKMRRKLRLIRRGSPNDDDSLDNISNHTIH